MNFILNILNIIQYTPFEIDCRNDYNDRYYVELNHKKFNELLYFLKDPEMYKNTKKFNL